MKLFIKEMNEAFAVEILHWRYEEPYNFYNNEVEQESIDELIEDSYYVVVDQDEKLVGFFCTGFSAQVPIGSQIGAYTEFQIDVGIGMRPELTGMGNGLSFFSFIVHFLQNIYKEVPLRLTVATFNERAIRLYEKIGFVKQIEFKNEQISFITMVKKC